MRFYRRNSNTRILFTKSYRQYFGRRGAEADAGNIPNVWWDTCIVDVKLVRASYSAQLERTRVDWKRSHERGPRQVRRKQGKVRNSVRLPYDKSVFLDYIRRAVSKAIDRMPANQDGIRTEALWYAYQRLQRT